MKMLFLPEWLEGEKASLHHAAEVAAGCDHCARTVHIVPGFAPSGVSTITFAFVSRTAASCRLSVWLKTDEVEGEPAGRT